MALHVFIKQTKLNQIPKYMKTTQVLDICKQVEDKVGTLATITDLKKCLEECDVDYLTQDEWEEVVSYLQRYYNIPNTTYPFGIKEELMDM